MAGGTPALLLGGVDELLPACFYIGQDLEKLGIGHEHENVAGLGHRCAEAL
jgi:hypothetical protein